MYDFHVNDMTEAVAASLGPDDDRKAVVRAAPVGYRDDKLAIVWTVEAVRSCKKGISDDHAVDATGGRYCVHVDDRGLTPVRSPTHRQRLAAGFLMAKDDPEDVGHRDHEGRWA